MGNSDSKANSDNCQVRQISSTPGKALVQGNGRKKSKSMHDDVPVWYDCCSCEAEPYWLEWFDRGDDPESNS